MLVFTRRRADAITIGDDITVTVLESDDGLVQIGISAPGGAVILKEEIYRRILESGKGELIDPPQIA